MEKIDDSLYSRQRYVLGDKAMSKMSNSHVLIVGLSGLGVEIAKNVILAGVQSVTIHDSEKATHRDLSTQFFISQSKLGNNRADACLESLADLNPYVKVKISAFNGTPLEKLPMSFFNDFSVVVLVDSPLKLQIEIDNYCRSRGIGFISSVLRGVVSTAFVDLGPKFEVFDKDGEECKEVFIGSIVQGPKDKINIHCLPNEKHGLESGDLVQFREVGGVDSLNSGIYRISVVSPYVFSVECDLDPEKYTGGGIATQVKEPIPFSFFSLEESVKNPSTIMFDTAKLDTPRFLHLAMLALDHFTENNGIPRPWSDADAEKLISCSRDINSSLQIVPEVDTLIVRKLSYTAWGEFQPLAAFMGGVVAQETLKAVSGKFSPLQQWLHVDFFEIVPDLNSNSSLFQPCNTFYDAQIPCIGKNLLEHIHNTSCFMVGAGAIGCEMLKNMAMMGVGTGQKGKIMVTDPDVIEKSNLNRQFLFRPSDIQKPKSSTAVNAAKRMNPSINVQSFMDKMDSVTEESYNDAFFKSLDVVVNALDNVPARQYMDSRCVSNEKPLLESGTLGTKGHVQVIVPHLTESYTSQADPMEASVPVCTIHSFPNNFDHCVQWARDKFEKLFITTAKDLASALEDSPFLRKIREVGVSQMVVVKRLINILEKSPSTFEDCVDLARLTFQTLFFNVIKHLLAAFPLDMKQNDGTFYWKSPKRPPTPVIFDPENQTHLHFLRSTAMIHASIFNVQAKSISDSELAAIAMKTEVPEFKLKAEKKVVAEQEKSEGQTESVLPSEEEWAGMLSNLVKLLDKNKQMKITLQHFEKDDDSNFHVDWIYSASNIRAQAYGITQSDKVTAKRIAGKIMPAIATTTSAVSSLVMGEFVKVLQQHRLSAYKNAFMNLALPSFVLSEPGEAKRTKITDTLYTTIWDNWAVKKGDITLMEFADHFLNKFNLTVTGVFQQYRMVYMHTPEAPMPMCQRRLRQRMSEILRHTHDDDYVDLIVTFADEKGEDVNGPIVRYYF